MIEQIKQALSDYDNKTERDDIIESVCHLQDNAPDYVRYLIGEVETWEQKANEFNGMLKRQDDVIDQFRKKNKELQKALESVRDTLAHKKNEDRTSWGLWSVANKALKEGEQDA